MVQSDVYTCYKITSYICNSRLFTAIKRVFYRAKNVWKNIETGIRSIKYGNFESDSIHAYHKFKYRTYLYVLMVVISLISLRIEIKRTMTGYIIRCWGTLLRATFKFVLILKKKINKFVFQLSRSTLRRNSSEKKLV